VESHGVKGLWVESDSEEHWESEPDNKIQLQLQNVNGIIFYITLLSWEFLLKWYNFFGKFY